MPASSSSSSSGPRGPTERLPLLIGVSSGTSFFKSQPPSSMSIHISPRRSSDGENSDSEVQIPLTWIDSYLPHLNSKPISHRFFYNLSAGVTVSLINLPLSLALAVAAGSTPLSGVISAVFAGVIASICGGSQFNITGPTGALSGILNRYAIRFGVQALPLLAISSGFIMFLAFVFNWDKYVTFLPSGVAHGFTLGVAFILAGGQIASICSLPPLPQHERFIENLIEVFSHLAEANLYSSIVFLCSWILLYSLVKKWPKIPWSVGIAAIGIAMGYFPHTGFIPRLNTLLDKYGELQPTLWNPSLSSSNPSIALMAAAPLDVLLASLSIAFVGVLESLISGKIADGLTHTSMNQRQETMAVALANIGAGIAGGVPATAALARTALSIRSGASSKLAGLVNGVATTSIALAMLPVFAYLPLCVISALLFQVAVGMIETKHLSRAFSIDRSAFWLTLLVAVLCLLLDPTAAIVVGAIVGLVRHSQKLATGFSEVTLTKDFEVGMRLDVKAIDEKDEEKDEEGETKKKRRKTYSAIEEREEKNNNNKENEGGLWWRVGQSLTNAVQGEHQLHQKINAIPKHSTFVSSSSSSSHTIIYRIVGDLTYISALNHSERIKKFSSSTSVILSLRYCYYVDLDGIDALEEVVKELEERQGKLVLMTGISTIVGAMLVKCKWFEAMKKDGKIFKYMNEATTFLQARSARAFEDDEDRSGGTDLDSASNSTTGGHPRASLVIPESSNASTPEETPTSRQLQTHGRRLSWEGHSEPQHQ